MHFRLRCSDEPAEQSGTTLKPFQAGAVLAGVLGTEIDSSQFGESDGKSVVAALIGAVPTVASLNSKKGVAAE